jgi:hypothetical protein
VDLGEIGWGVDCIHTVMDLKMLGRAVVGFSRRTQIRELNQLVNYSFHSDEINEREAWDIIST